MLTVQLQTIIKNYISKTSAPATILNVPWSHHTHLLLLIKTHHNNYKLILTIYSFNVFEYSKKNLSALKSKVIKRKFFNTNPSIKHNLINFTFVQCRKLWHRVLPFFNCMLFFLGLWTGGKKYWHVGYNIEDLFDTLVNLLFKRLYFFFDTNKNCFVTQWFWSLVNLTSLLFNDLFMNFKYYFLFGIFGVDG